MLVKKLGLDYLTIWLHELKSSGVTKEKWLIWNLWNISCNTIVCSTFLKNHSSKVLFFPMDKESTLQGGSLQEGWSLEHHLVLWGYKLIESKFWRWLWHKMADVHLASKYKAEAISGPTVQGGLPVFLLQPFQQNSPWKHARGLRLILLSWNQVCDLT